MPHSETKSSGNAPADRFLSRWEGERSRLLIGRGTTACALSTFYTYLTRSWAHNPEIIWWERLTNMQIPREVSRPLMWLPLILLHPPVDGTLCSAAEQLKVCDGSVGCQWLPTWNSRRSQRQPASNLTTPQSSDLWADDVRCFLDLFQPANEA